MADAIVEDLFREFAAGKVLPEPVAPSTTENEPPEQPQSPEKDSDRSRKKDGKSKKRKKDRSRSPKKKKSKKSSRERDLDSKEKGHKKSKKKHSKRNRSRSKSKDEQNSLNEIEPRKETDSKESAPKASASSDLTTAEKSDSGQGSPKIDAIKLTDYLKKKGHSIPSALAEEKEKLKQKSPSPEKLPSPPKVEPFPLSKSGKIPKASSADNLVGFLPRNVKLKTQAAKNSPLLEPVPNGTPSPPPLSKAKAKFQEVSDDEEDFLVKKKEPAPPPKKQSGKITFGALKTTEFPKAATDSKPKTSGKGKGEDGEIPTSCGEDSSGDDVDLANDTDGELSEWSEAEVVRPPSEPKQERRERGARSSSPARSGRRSTSPAKSGRRYRSPVDRDHRNRSSSRRRRSPRRSPERRRARRTSERDSYRSRGRGSSHRRSPRRSSPPRDSHNRRWPQPRGRTHKILNPRKRRRSGSRSGSDDDQTRIDKKKLLEIAKKNASAMLHSGTLQQISNMSASEIAKIKAGGKSVNELVDYCKKLQSRKKRGNEDSSSSDSEPAGRNSEDEKDFINHPFAINPNKNIVMNIPNAVPLPIATPGQRAQQELVLRQSFPVSSGQQHRTKEDEWQPAEPYIPLPAPIKAKAITEKGEPEHAPPDILALPLPPPPVPPPAGTPAAIMPPPPPPPPVFQEPPPPPQDGIGNIVSQRLEAVKRLQANPNDIEALKKMHAAEQQMKQWAESKNMPGAFTGNASTGVNCLTPQQLAPPDKRFQAWAKKDQLRTAKTVRSDVGMSLLQKMGWKPGERLGKHQTGALEPLSLDIKADRKGLVALEEMPASKSKPNVSFTKDLKGKHPVSALMEVCSKRRWPPPSFDCIESGGSHNRRFLWKVVVNGVEYQAATPSPNKKNAKSVACQVVLQSLGLVPRESNLPIVIG